MTLSVKIKYILLNNGGKIFLSENVMFYVQSQMYNGSVSFG